MLQRAERRGVVEPEHLHERRVRGQQLAARRRLVHAVDDVVEQRAEPRLAFAQRTSRPACGEWRCPRAASSA